MKKIISITTFVFFGLCFGPLALFAQSGDQESSPAAAPGYSQADPRTDVSSSPFKEITTKRLDAANRRIDVLNASAETKPMLEKGKMKIEIAVLKDKRDAIQDSLKTLSSTPTMDEEGKIGDAVTDLEKSITKLENDSNKK